MGQTPEQHLGAAAAELRERHGGFWGEDPANPVADWRREVDDDDTRLGYWEWAAAHNEGA